MAQLRDLKMRQLMSAMEQETGHRVTSDQVKGVWLWWVEYYSSMLLQMDPVQAFKRDEASGQWVPQRKHVSPVGPAASFTGTEPDEAADSVGHLSPVALLQAMKSIGGSRSGLMETSAQAHSLLQVPACRAWA